MAVHAGNGNGNAHGGASFANRLLFGFLRRPSVALLRRYADWVEQACAFDVSGEGASYAGSAIYVCRAEDIPLVYLHRAHYDDRTLIPEGPELDPLAYYGMAAGLIVSRGTTLLPELERSVRAGNGAIMPVGRGALFAPLTQVAAEMAVRTRAPISVIRAQSTRAVRVGVGREVMSWPAPQGRVHVDYGPLVRPTGDAAEIAQQLQRAFG